MWLLKMWAFPSGNIMIASCHRIKHCRFLGFTFKMTHNGFTVINDLKGREGRGRVCVRES